MIDKAHVCASLLKIYNENAIVIEPTGDLSITALDQLKSNIQGKHVVSIISGGNNDIMRMEEIKRDLYYRKFWDQKMKSAIFNI